MRSEALHLHRIRRRPIRCAWQTGVRVAALLAFAWAAGCTDETVVDPPFGAPEAESRAMAMASASDRDILVALYNSTDGPNWRDNNNWLTNAPLGEWYGVRVDVEGRVVGLDLAGSWDDQAGRYVKHGLKGTVPVALADLAKLEHLDLAINKLSGPIPVELGGLTKLKRLYLWDNDLTGPIPVELDGLANLESLDLGGNALSGDIPPELGRLANLTHLILESNELTGTIPSELGGLVNLETLGLGGNALSGDIPPELGRLANLVSLHLDWNALSGIIPPQLGGLANLRILYLSSNALSGTVPLNFLQLSRLFVFGFEKNGHLCLPDALVAWYEALDHGSGSVCPDREVLQALYEAAGGGAWANADGWLGDGTIGDWHGIEVDSLGLVSTVDLAGNGLSGGLPGSLGSLAGLTALRIGDNALSGRLPSSLKLTPLRELRYANTALCASVEAWFQEWLHSLARHQGTGLQCPPLSDREILAALYEQTDGPNWEESRNWLTETPLGDWHGVGTDADGQVTNLDLRWNGLDGPIPVELGGLSELNTLILFDNRLAGPIPPELGGLEKASLVVLAANRLAGPIPPELGGLASAEELWLNGNELTSVPPELGALGSLRELSLAGNQLTSVPAELGNLARLEYLNLNFNQVTSVPPELGRLARLRYLGLWSNELTSIPPELGDLGSLEELDLDGNRLASIPRELARLDSLQVLWLASNELTSVPPELGGLRELEILSLADNRLTGIPFGPSGYPSLWTLDLSSNEFSSFPVGLGELGSLRVLELDGNRLTDIPSGLGGPAGAGRPGSAAPRGSATLPGTQHEPEPPWRVGLAENPGTEAAAKLDRSSGVRAGRGSGGRRSAPDQRSRAVGFPSLEILDLSSNEFSGSLPAGLLEFTGLASLGLKDNAGLSGPLPLRMTALSRLEDLHTTGTELCAPKDSEFLDWLDGVTRQRVAHCVETDAAAYLTQAVQSREFPVPLVAGEPALLRVFLTSERTGGQMPLVRATFHRDGAVVHRVDIPGTSHPIPAAIDESSLSKSANAEIPGHVIQPGIEVVIEPDPGGTLDPDLGVPRRIPPEGRLAIDVRAMPVFEVTLVPFILRERPDRSIVQTVAAMAADPEGHQLFERTHLLLPVSKIDATAHAPVLTSTNNGFGLLEQVEMIRVAEGGRGHYLAVMAPPTTPGGLGGVAYGIGSWSSFSVLSSEIIAHEFGHNRALYHAPCGGAGGPDRYYPYGAGIIGAWGYDFATGELVPPDRSDYMSYCDPTWTSDYQFTNAVRYRLETESNSIVVTAGDRAGTASDPALLLWGGLDGEGAPALKPSFFVDAPPAPPETDGPWRLTGEDPSGATLFSMPFAMAEFTDTDDERAGFSFVVPVAWTGELARITLDGPGGTALLDRDTDLPMTILRDAATGRIRGILEGPPAEAAAGSGDAAAAQAGQDLQIIFSRGIPNR